jgi:vitamin B12 transporter
VDAKANFNKSPGSLIDRVERETIQPAVFAKEKQMTYRFFKHRCFFYFLFIILFPAVSLLAANDEPKPAYPQKPIIHEVVVEGEAVEKSATVTIVTAQQIEERGIRTVAQALEMVPGTHVRVGGNGEAYIRIRGFRQREVAVLIDGIPASSPYDGQLDLSNLPVQTIERIDVVKGASSVLYGANAMGGVINIITRKAGGNRGIRFNGEYGSGKSAQLGTALQGHLGKIRYFVGGTYQDIGYYPLSNRYVAAANQGKGQRENSDKTSRTSRVNLDWDLGPTTGLGLGFTYIDLDKGLPHHESDKKAKFQRFTDWREGILDLFFRKGFNHSNLESRVYYQYFHSVLDSYDDRTYTTQDSKNGFTDTLKDHALGGDLVFRFTPHQSHLFKTALRFQHAVHRQQPDVGDQWLRFSISSLSLPLEGEWNVNQQVTLVYGASLDMLFFKTAASNTNKNKTAVNPQVSLLWSPLANLHFKGSASLKTRFPSMRELFDSNSGNPGLDPMKATGLEIGVEYFLSSRLGISLVGFHNNIRDLINRVNKDSTYINIDKAVFKGIEAGLNWQWTAFNRFYASYTLLHAIDKSTADNSYIQYRPKHKLDAGVFVQLPARFLLNLNTSYVSAQIYYDDNNKEKSLAPYTLLDIGLSRRLGRGVEIYITALNLFDVNYYESEGYPREGRQIFAGTRLEIGR